MTRKQHSDQKGVALVPLAVSQHTASVFGFKNERQFLEWVVTNNVPHARQGKSRIVEASVARQFLFAEAERAPDSGRVTALAALSPDDRVDQVLATIGRKLVR